MFACLFCDTYIPLSNFWSNLTFSFYFLSYLAFSVKRQKKSNTPRLWQCSSHNCCLDVIKTRKHTYVARRSVCRCHSPRGLNTSGEPWGTWSTCWPDSCGLPCHSVTAATQQLSKLSPPRNNVNKPPHPKTTGSVLLPYTVVLSWRWWPSPCAPHPWRSPWKTGKSCRLRGYRSLGRGWRRWIWGLEGNVCKLL